MLSPKLSKRSLTGPAAALLAFALWPVLASAQSQDQGSVAEAARRAREQKKAASKPARTLTNDDLPSLKAESLPAAGDAANADPAHADQGKTEAVQAAPAAAVEPVDDPQADKNKRAKLEAALRQAKAELVEAQGEFDVRKRQAALDSDTFYSKPDYASDDAGKSRLEAQAGQLSEKKSQVDALKAKVAALESALGQAPEPEKTPPN